VTEPEFPPRRQRYREIRHCPRCGAAYRTLDFHAGESLFLCACCGFEFYQNPLPAAVAVVAEPTRPDAVLVLRRRTSPGVGMWCVPGGFIRYGESPAAAAVREAREETGLDIIVGPVLCAGLVDYRYRGRHVCVVEVAYLGHPRGAPLAAGRITGEAAELRFRPLTALLAAPEALAFPEQIKVLQAYWAWLDTGRITVTWGASGSIARDG
jgi:ADP-ribose pyrophosphatase YjhB (NUDIX family)